MIPRLRRGLQPRLVLVQGQRPLGVVAVRVGEDGAAVVGGGPEGRAAEAVVERGSILGGGVFSLLVSFFFLSYKTICWVFGGGMGGKREWVCWRGGERWGEREREGKNLGREVSMYMYE